MDAGGDQRCHPRLYGSFPAIVRGVDASGRVFEVKAVVDHISAVGLSMRLGQCTRRGERIFIIVRLSTTPPGWRIQSDSLTRRRVHQKRRMSMRRHLLRHAEWVYSRLVRLFSGVSPASGPCVAIRGIVVRTDRQLNNTCGVSVAFTHRRFL